MEANKLDPLCSNAHSSPLADNHEAPDSNSLLNFVLNHAPKMPLLMVVPPPSSGTVSSGPSPPSSFANPLDLMALSQHPGSKTSHHPHHRHVNARRRSLDCSELNNKSFASTLPNARPRRRRPGVIKHPHLSSSSAGVSDMESSNSFESLDPAISREPFDCLPFVEPSTPQHWGRKEYKDRANDSSSSHSTSSSQSNVSTNSSAGGYFVCERCGKAYPHRASLQRHQNSDLKCNLPLIIQHINATSGTSHSLPLPRFPTENLPHQQCRPQQPTKPRPRSKSAPRPPSLPSAPVSQTNPGDFPAPSKHLAPPLLGPLFVKSEPQEQFTVPCFNEISTQTFSTQTFDSFPNFELEFSLIPEESSLFFEVETQTPSTFEYLGRSDPSCPQPQTSNLSSYTHLPPSLAHAPFLFDFTDFSSSGFDFSHFLNENSANSLTQGPWRPEQPPDSDSLIRSRKPTHVDPPLPHSSTCCSTMSTTPSKVSLKTSNPNYKKPAHVESPRRYFFENSHKPDPSLPPTPTLSKDVSFECVSQNAQSQTIYSCFNVGLLDEEKVKEPNIDGHVGDIGVQTDFFSNMTE